MSRLSKIISQVLVEIIALGRRGYLEYRARTTNLPFFRNRFIVWPLFLNVVFLILNFFYAFLKLREKEELIPLHYNIYFGVDLIGDKFQVFKLPLVGLMVLVVNYFLALIVYKQEKLASYILVYFSLIVIVILIVGSVFILNI